MTPEPHATGATGRRPNHPAAAPAVGRKLRAGDAAPPFTAVDINGRTVDLAALRGTPIWLSFLRFANCPLAQCKLEKMKAMAAANPGLQPIAVGTPGTAGRDRYREAGFPVVADPDQRLYRCYGAEHSFPRAIVPTNQLATLRAFRNGYWLHLPVERPLWRMPADFLIDEGGRIAVAHYGRRMHDDIAQDRVEAFARAG